MNWKGKELKTYANAYAYCKRVSVDKEPERMAKNQPFEHQSR